MYIGISRPGPQGTSESGNESLNDIGLGVTNQEVHRISCLEPTGTSDSRTPKVHRKLRSLTQKYIGNCDLQPQVHRKVSL